MLQNRKGMTLYIFVFAVVVAYLFLIFPEYTMINLYALLLVPPTIVGAVFLLAKGVALARELPKGERVLILVSLALLPLVSMYPLITQPFMFGDDLWTFPVTNYQSTLELFVGMSRPIPGAVMWLFRSITWENSYLLRLFTFGITVLINYMVFFWSFYITRSKIFSLALCVFITLSPSMADLIAFAAIWPFVLGMLFSLLSVVGFYEAYRTKNRLWVVFAFLSLLVGFNHYAISTPIVFLFAGIYLLKKELSREDIKLIVGYGVLYGSGALAYLFSTRFLCSYYMIEGQSSTRGAISFTPSFLLEKLSWFFQEVLPQSVYRVLDYFTLGWLTMKNNLFWGTSLRVESNVAIGLYFAFLLFSLIGVALYFRRISRKESAIRTSVVFLLVPVSFYPFFILPESTYLSYYAFPNYCICVLLMLVASYGYSELLRKKISIAKVTPLLIAGAIIVSLWTNHYAETAWVDYCSVPYICAKMQINNQIDCMKQTKRIHVYGYATPHGISVYSVNLIVHLLYEMGENPYEYMVTCSENRYYDSAMTSVTCDWLMLNASEDQKNVLGKWYIFEPMYSNYYLSDTIAPEDIVIVQECFRRSGLIPGEGEAAVVDITSLHQWNAL